MKRRKTLLAAGILGTITWSIFDILMVVGLILLIPNLNALQILDIVLDFIFYIFSLLLSIICIIASDVKKYDKLKSIILTMVMFNLIDIVNFCMAMENIQYITICSIFIVLLSICNILIIIDCKSKKYNIEVKEDVNNVLTNGNNIILNTNETLEQKQQMLSLEEELKKLDKMKENNEISEEEYKEIRKNTISKSLEK